MDLNESDEYVHKETRYTANIIDIKNGVVSFIYFDEQDEFQTGDMELNDFKNDFSKKV